MSEPISKPISKEKFFTPGEVAKMLRIHPKTVSRWAQRYGLGIKTLGGHRRFRKEDIAKMFTFEGRTQ